MTLLIFCLFILVKPSKLIKSGNGILSKSSKLDSVKVSISLLFFNTGMAKSESICNYIYYS